MTGRTPDSLVTGPHRADGSEVDDTRATGERVERLLEQLRRGPDPRAAALAEELVGCLVRLYGAGLARVVRIVGPDAGPALCADPLVESLLLVHDLHPLDAGTRIGRALDRVRPYLGSGTAEATYLGIDERGVARVRVTGTGHGCHGSPAAVRPAIEAAVREAAPETTGVEVDIAAAPPPLLQIRSRGTT